jgi:hypothetical protein
MSELKKIVNGEVMDLTADEIADLETRKQNVEAEYAQLNADKEAKDTLKASAKAKLIAGEALTEEEANVLVGV